MYNQRPKSSALYRVIGCHLGIRHTVGQSEISMLSCSLGRHGYNHMSNAHELASVSLGCHGYNYMSNTHELASVTNSYCHEGRA